MYNGNTMTLLCIPSHEEKAKLQQSANNYFGGVNGLASNTGNSSKKADAVKRCLPSLKTINLPRRNIRRF